MLRPTESPIIFLQQLGPRSPDAGGQGRADGHRLHRQPSFVPAEATNAIEPGATRGSDDAASTRCIGEQDFDLPEGCSVDYDLTVVEMLRQLTHTSARDAIEEYCRSYMEEEGLRPTAAQAFRAGHDPAIVTQQVRQLVRFLRTAELLGEREAAVADAYGDILRAFQTESITKCYKLVAIRALLHDGALRTGEDVATQRRNVARADAGRSATCARRAGARSSPTSPSAPADKWARYWRKWPIAHLSGTGVRRARPNALVPARRRSDRADIRGR